MPPTLTATHPASRSRIRLLVALSAALALLVAPLATPPAAAEDWPAAWEQAEREMIEHINADRRAEGLGALRLDTDVREVARDWSETMPEEGFKHRERFWELYPDGYRSGGENIGYSSTRQTLENTTRWMHGAFMDSEGHHRNIMNSSFTHVGVGVHVDDRNVVWYTINFMGHPERAAAEPEPEAGDYAFGSSVEDEADDEQVDAGDDTADEQSDEADEADDSDAGTDDDAPVSDSDDSVVDEDDRSDGKDEDDGSDDASTPIEQLLNFIDVDSDNVHAAAILRMAAEEIISGYPDDTFRPNLSVNRAQLATLLVRQLDLELDGEAPSFSDLPSSHPHAKNIAIAASHGLVNGYDDGTFRPGQALNRAQAATMLVRAFEVPAADGHSFSDVTGANVHRPAIAAAAEHGLVGGYPDETFRPGNELTRGQIATILDRQQN